MLHQGRKDDNNKERMDLVPWNSVREMAKALMFGAAKYGDNNWREGIKHSRLFASAMRHLTFYWSGETLDQESGLNHIAHAMTNLAMMAETPEWDDRYFTGVLEEIWKLSDEKLRDIKED